MTDPTETTRKLHVLSSHQTDLGVVNHVSLPETKLHVRSDHSTKLHLIKWGVD